MSGLTHEQKRLLFDYCFELTNKTATAQVKKLLASHPEAENLCEKIKAALAPLEALQTTTCPDYLVEETFTVCSSTPRLQKTI